MKHYNSLLLLIINLIVSLIVFKQIINIKMVGIKKEDANINYH